MMQPGGVPTDPGPEARVWIHRMELGDRQGKSSGIINKLLCYKSKRRIIKINQNTEWLTKSSQTTCLDLFNKTQASWNPGCFKIHWKRDFKIANHFCTFSPIYSFFSPSESLCESESLKPLFRTHLEFSSLRWPALWLERTFPEISKTQRVLFRR